MLLEISVGILCYSFGHACSNLWVCQGMSLTGIHMDNETTKFGII